MGNSRSLIKMGLAATLLLAGCAMTPGSKGLKEITAELKTTPQAATTGGSGANRQSADDASQGKANTSPQPAATSAPAAPPHTPSLNSVPASAGAANQVGQGMAEAAKDLALKPEEPAATPSPQATATPSPEATPSAAPSASVPEQQTDFFYFSYDDSASTAGVELTKHALNNRFMPQKAWARPWEFLNFEKFQKLSQQDIGLFNVSMGIWKHGDVKEPALDVYELGVHVSAPELDQAARKNLVLTLVVDVSGSMESPSVVLDRNGQAPSLMKLARTGLEQLAGSLKSGDIVNIVRFDNQASTLLEGFPYEPGAPDYLQAVQKLVPAGGTNLNAGIEEGYRVAQKHYDANKLNRVVMLTDALANIGVVDPAKISTHTRINNAEGIYFSGLGFGPNFNEGFLNQLTEAGRGAYFSVITEQDARRAFKDRFMALVNVAARNVQFRLDYPAALKRRQSAAEESSKIQSEVQPTNFSYNTSQYFWEEFTASGETSVSSGKMKLSIFYTNPETQQPVTETYEKGVAELLGAELTNIQDAHLITLLTSLIQGKVDKERAQKELDTLLSTHGSALKDEYRLLIEEWIRQQGSGTTMPPLERME